MVIKSGILFSIVIIMCVGTPAFACGVKTDCNIGNRTYRAYQPPDATDRAIIFFHGVGGRASKQIMNSGLRAVAEDLNAILIAAQSAQKEWNVPGAPADYAANATTELQYFDELQSDIQMRFGVNPENTIVAGFSSGSMVIWNIACFRGQNAFGFVANSGTFWDPMPSSCPSTPVNLNHYHGKSDTTVPMEGRQIFNSHQGDVLQAIEILTGVAINLSSVDRTRGKLECYLAREGSDGHVELCLFEGGHRFSADYIADAWDIFSADR